jgi:hypothetical protein
MKNRNLALVALAASLCAGALMAQQAKRPSRPVLPANAETVSYAELDKLPDWRGIWQPNIGQIGGDQPMLIGKYKKRYEEEKAKVAANPGYDIPEKHNNCEPPGMPTMMTMPYSLEFVFAPGKIIVNQEAEMMVRRIYTDGRPLPSEDDIDPNYFGYSVGHWEGDTLVVDTVGTKEGQRLGEIGITNSDKLKINERIYLDKDNKNLLHLDFTFTDPEVLAQPWHRKHTFRRDRTWDILEYVCAENDRHPIDDKGQTHAAF